ncbi:hypothetical protein BDW71DRAFT_170418 [Aspergillus fruticulosus]
MGILCLISLPLRLIYSRKMGNFCFLRVMAVSLLHRTGTRGSDCLMRDKSYSGCRLDSISMAQRSLYGLRVGPRVLRHTARIQCHHGIEGSTLVGTTNPLLPASPSFPLCSPDMKRA